MHIFQAVSHSPKTNKKCASFKHAFSHCRGMSLCAGEGTETSASTITSAYGGSLQQKTHC